MKLFEVKRLSSGQAALLADFRFLIGRQSRQQGICKTIDPEIVSGCVREFLELPTSVDAQ